MIRGTVLVLVLALATLLAAPVNLVQAQNRLASMPGYERYKKMAPLIPSSVKPGTLSVRWKEDGTFDYRQDGKLYQFDPVSRSAKEVVVEAGKQPPVAGPKRPGAKRGVGGPARGRQFTSALSPDGTLRATHRNRNIYLTELAMKGDKQGDKKTEIAVTTEGNDRTRIKFGTASWVYGEELFQREALWWSPDSKALAFYRFDESKVTDYYLALDQAKLQNRLGVEPYPRAGDDNPVVDLLVYHVASKKTVRIDVRDGKPFDNDSVGHYVYRISWSPDGSELLFLRTNRRQNILEFVAAEPLTGKCRVIVRDEWPASWVENLPTITFLADNRRFLWSSERTGWKNFYLYDLSGKLLTPITRHEFEVDRIVRIDEKAGLLWYMARSGDNPMKLQLHRAGLDGKNDRRLTDPAFSHRVDLAPNGKFILDIAEKHDTAPTTRLLDGEGNLITELAKSDLRKFEELGLQRVERFTFKAADGKTDLYGMLHKPSGFDPNRKYPLLVSVYAGPGTNGARETFTLPSALTELGFLVATLDSRSAAGRGKRFLDAIYLNLGVTEVDDQAAGVRALATRSYVDGRRVGIHGTSYGGYVSVLALLRHPEVFQAACASSAVTDFRHYDSIYTERYLWLPQANKKGYDAGSALTHVERLRGRLMLYYGTADDNVHPSNTLRLIRALQLAGKSFDVQVGPDMGHTSISQPRMLEFFLEALGRERRDAE